MAAYAAMTLKTSIPGAYLFCLYVCDKEMSWPQEASYYRRGDLPWINFENFEEE